MRVALTVLGEEEMGKPILEGFKYWFGRDIIDDAMPSDADVEIGGYGTRQDVPAEVVGGNIGLD